jgi:hypothetical protein
MRAELDHGVSGAIDQGRLRAHIQAQSCPWCGRGGLRPLASHTIRAHGIYAHELRELAGLAPTRRCALRS